MKLFVTLLAFCLSGCAVVWVVEKTEAVFKQNRPSTRPWHFEGEKVVYDKMP